MTHILVVTYHDGTWSYHHAVNEWALVALAIRHGRNIEVASIEMATF